MKISLNKRKLDIPMEVLPEYTLLEMKKVFNLNHF